MNTLETVISHIADEADKRDCFYSRSDTGAGIDVMGDYGDTMIVWGKDTAYCEIIDYQGSIDFSDRWDGEGDPAEVAKQWLDALLHHTPKKGIS